MTEYIKLTEGLFSRIMGKREEEPTCSYPGCTVKLSDMIGENVSRTMSRGKARYRCKEHDIENRRI